MYTIEQFAEIFNISYITAYRLVKSGKVKAIRIGEQYRIPESEIEIVKKEGTK